LRKAACRRLAELGCTVHEIAAISGHSSLKEIERYTRAVSQEKLARAAMAKATADFDNLSNLEPATTARGKR
jgi:integrase